MPNKTKKSTVGAGFRPRPVKHSIRDYALALDHLQHQLGRANTMVHLLTGDLKQRDLKIAQLQSLNDTQASTIRNYQSRATQHGQIIEAWEKLWASYEAFNQD